MRAFVIGLGAILGLGLLTPSAKAQDGGFSDPFFLYYGYFLPRQNALAAQGQPEDFYRSQSIQRQAAAQTDRRGLYDPSSAIGLDELDPLREFGSRSASNRMVATTPSGLRSTVSMRGHAAPSDYFHRVSSPSQRKTYYPGLRSGFGAARSRGASPAPAGPSASRFVPSPMSGSR